MTFGLKNAGATYQRAMNHIFHDLLGVILEVYIDDVVIKLAGFKEHLANLRLAFERMRKYNLKMNTLKCAFGVTVGRFLGFIVHDDGIGVSKENRANREAWGVCMQMRCAKAIGKDKLPTTFHCKLGGKGGLIFAFRTFET
jgi:hypothetical protein